MANRYWVGGTASWDGTAGTKWALTSGGTGGQAVPTTADDVFFDANSGASTVTIATGNTGAKSINCTGFTGTLAGTVAITVSGSVTLVSGMTFSHTGVVTINATATITSAGKTFGGITFSGTAATYTLADTFTASGVTTLTAGTLTLNGNTFNTNTISLTGTTARSIAFGSAKIVVTGNAATVWSGATLTGFSYTGTPAVEFSYSGATGTRTINHGNTSGGTEANAVNFTITAGSDAVSFGSANKVLNLTFNSAFTGTGGIAGANGFIYGDLTLSPNQTVPANASAFTFSKTGGTQVFTSNGVSIDRPVTITGTSTVQLGSDLTLITGTSSGALTLTSGTFDANNYNVTVAGFSSSGTGTRTITMGSGLWTLSSTGTVWNLATTTNLTFNKNTANILLSNTSTTTRTFAGGGLTYNKLTIGGTTGISTLTISGSNTFSELASTKTVAHTIQFAAGTTNTFTTWSIAGTAGNAVTVKSVTAGSTATLAIAGGGYLTGVNYLVVNDIIGSPISDAWYIGPNSTINTVAPNTSYGLFTVQRATQAVVILNSTSSSSWTVPSDWNSGNNTIHIIGGGGGGAGAYISGTNAAGGGGGGGAGYTKLTNQTYTVGASITYQAGTAGAAGAAGADGTAGGTTSWNAGATTAGGGGGGQATITPTSTGGAAGAGSTFNGGAGGSGSTSTAASTGNAGGGGGGAGGPNGNGGNGGNGFGSTTGANVAGGGGGGSGGGTNGGNATAGTGGTGGNSYLGTGGGASNAGGTIGGGGGGSTSAVSTGGYGIDVYGIGSGAGGGGAEDTATTLGTNIGGWFGGGGGGGGNGTAGVNRAGSAGAQGAIIIVYLPLAVVSKGNFFMLM